MADTPLNCCLIPFMIRLAAVTMMPPIQYGQPLPPKHRPAVPGSHETRCALAAYVGGWEYAVHGYEYGTGIWARRLG